MCFSFAGRLQTRLVTLTGPLLLTWLFAAANDNASYWLLFNLMLGLSLILDIGVYSWLIDYQPRWLTLLLAGGEFLVLKWIVEWPYPFEIRLRTRQALIFYLLCWLLIWLTLHVLLPRYRPRWVEENGRLIWGGQVQRRLAVPQLRRMYAVAITTLAVALAPWTVAAARTPAHSVMTGLLVNESGQLAELAAATVGAQGGAWRSAAGAVGWLALHGRWPVLPVYQIAWIIGAALLLLGVQLLWPQIAGWRVLLIGMLVIVMPLSWLLIGAGLVWLLQVCQLQPRPARWLRQLLGGVLLLGATFSWGLAWSRLDRAPLLYLDQGTWQALTWLAQRPDVHTHVSAPPHLMRAVVGLTGRPLADAAAPGVLELTSGAGCAAGTIRFRHGSVCIVARPFLMEHSR